MLSSLKRKLSFFAFVGIASTTVTGLAALWSLDHVIDSERHNALATTVLRNHLEADMMHDALRGDVLSALLASTVTHTDRGEVLTELQRHAARFREMVEKNRDLPVDAEIVEALTRIRPALDGYVAAAEAVATAASDDSARARALLPAFLDSFHALEGEMSQLSDLIEASTRKAADSAEQAAINSERLMMCIMVLGAALALITVYIIARRLLAMVNRLGDLTETLRTACVSGDSALATSPVTGNGDELQRVADTLRSTIAAVQHSIELVAEGAEREKRNAEAVRTQVDDILPAVNAAARGDLTRPITVCGDDAVGLMASALNELLDDLRRRIAAVLDHAESLARASAELTGVSTRMAASATDTSNQAGVVSAASEQVSHHVQSVAIGTEEMGASIREIANNATEAARVSIAAVKTAENARTIIGQLGDSSAEIGQVIKVITSIAQQTNLLALNATIEAARAGEAGKGFAVVANEVKELAKQTAAATEDISQRIEAIQSDAKGAVGAIAEVTRVIAQVNDISNTIASAVEEQTATTNEISRNIGQAAAGSVEIADNITRVAAAAQSTTTDTSHTLRASEELARTASELFELVARFTVNDQGQTQRNGTQHGAPAPQFRRRAA